MAQTSRTQSQSNAWLISYSGFMTLLFGLFVVLYSQAKGKSQTPPEEKPKPAASSSASPENSGRGRGGENTAHEMLLGLFKDVQTEFGSGGDYSSLGGDVAFSEQSQGILVRITAKGMFEPGKAEVPSELRPLLDRIGQVLAKTSNEIQIIGHTDPREKLSQGSPTGWELSAQRAAWVARYWILHHGLKPEKLTVSGVSHFKSELTDSEFSADLARRIEILISDSP